MKFSPEIFQGRLNNVVNSYEILLCTLLKFCIRSDMTYKHQSKRLIAAKPHLYVRQ
ncbi:MAG: hypothetical protein LBJ67_18000 [Planctomycetaceae bacterium]|nr:hypothetical protein [Planctomycetaceae bacterium]